MADEGSLQLFSAGTSNWADPLVPTFPFRGIELTAGNSHVDHEPPATFASVAGQWLAAVGGFEAVKISEPTDQQWAAEMVCSDQKGRWQEHHRQHAKLRLVSAGANLSEIRRA